MDKLQPKHFRQIVWSIFKLRENPNLHDAKQLVGFPEYQRLDVGEFRIIYGVENQVLMITVIGKRNDDKVYKKIVRKIYDVAGREKSENKDCKRPPSNFAYMVYSDKIRDLFPFTHLIRPEGVTLEDGKKISLDTFSKL